MRARGARASAVAVRSIVAIAAAVAIVAAVAVGCGVGHSLAEGDGGAGEGDAGLVAACPEAAPANGDACATDGLVCEYGAHPSFGCNATATCAAGRWSVPPASHDARCTFANLGCPASRADVPRGEACVGQDGTSCAYPDGICVCTVPLSGPPLVDASNAERWTCDTPPPGCPTPRPRAGAPCAGVDTVCDYGACSLPRGVALACKGGAWQPTQSACPL